MLKYIEIDFWNLFIKIVFCTFEVAKIFEKK